MTPLILLIHIVGIVAALALPMVVGIQALAGPPGAAHRAAAPRGDRHEYAARRAPAATRPGTLATTHPLFRDADPLETVPGGARATAPAVT